MITTKVHADGFLIYAPTIKPKKCRLELNHQIDLVSLIRYHFPVESSLLFHVANEGQQAPQYRLKLNKSGNLKGVSDVICIWRGAHHPTFALELKKPDRTISGVSKEQREFLKNSHRVGGFAVAAFGALAGWHAWLDYLGYPANDPLRSKADHLFE